MLPYPQTPHACFFPKTLPVDLFPYLIQQCYLIKIKHYHLLTHLVTYHTCMWVSHCHMFCQRCIKLRLTGHRTSVITTFRCAAGRTGGTWRQKTFWKDSKSRVMKMALLWDVLLCHWASCSWCL